MREQSEAAKIRNHLESKPLGYEFTSKQLAEELGLRSSSPVAAVISTEIKRGGRAISRRPHPGGFSFIHRIESTNFVTKDGVKPGTGGDGPPGVQVVEKNMMDAVLNAAVVLEEVRNELRKPHPFGEEKILQYLRNLLDE